MATAADILRKPYARVVIPEEDGSFFAQIKEFPGCIATGSSAPDVLRALEEVAESWIEATFAKGQRVPEPMAEPEYSGKLVFRLPKTLHAKVAQAAEADGTSLNSLILTAVSYYLGASEMAAAQISSDQFLENIKLVWNDPTPSWTQVAAAEWSPAASPIHFFDPINPAAIPVRKLRVHG